MPTVHLTTGLPASGKTGLARGLDALRFSLDDYRAMMRRDRSTWNGDLEKIAVEAMIRSAHAAVEGGRDIVVDNTHLTANLPGRYKDAFPTAVFRVHDLMAVPVEECIRRDAEREQPVGEDVIRNLHARHVKATRNGWRLTDAWMNDRHTPDPYIPDTSLPTAVLCDIDGTLALNESGRGPYDFHRCGEDTVNRAVADELALHDRANHIIVLLSGRGSEYRPETVAWLAAHGIAYDELWMRPLGDFRRDDLVKAELFDKHVRHRFAVRFTLDDRDRVVALWRRMGIPTWQVNYGAF
ncbi:polynucleotide kinase [Embleya scabrispora]|uniref:Polynucleotide kinase n=1 Tax=Embleya scabrispora TaxID=159449 RepID=A0A1T3P911_9ACTN|nr:AAA family ATPase [Embleya scabrispora]OPC85350.1 polynucleotide kinase [Embleya scabrispora]